MYVRQMKQFLRGVDPTFDERNFGFHSLNDLLRACQKDGLFRMERDRQGVMRFFQGNVMRPVDVGGAGTPESEAEAQIRHGREAAAAGEEHDVVEGDVVQELEATPPVIDVPESADVDEPQAGAPAPVTDEGAEPAEEPPARGRRKRTAKAASSAKAPRARKTASSRAKSGTRKRATAAE
jgi:hypothetical protein